MSLATDGEVFVRRGLVTGISAFDGSEGFTASYGIHMRVKLKAPGAGSRTQIYPCDKKEVVERIRAVITTAENGIMADVHMVELASKKATQMTVIDVKPIAGDARPKAQ